MRARVEGAAIGGFHDAWPAAGHDDAVLVGACVVGQAHDAAELAGHLVIAAILKDALSHRKPAGEGFVAGGGGKLRSQCIHLALGGVGFADARAAEHHDGRMDVVLFKQQLGLEVVDLQAHAAHAVRRHEVHVLVGAPVARAGEDRADALRRIRIFILGFGLLPGKRLAPVQRMRLRWRCPSSWSWGCLP